MNQDIKNELAKRAVVRAQSGLYFLQDVVLPHIQSGTDAAYSRSAYILLSFNTELILSALFILGSEKTNESEIIKDLIAASKLHNLQSLFDQIREEFRFGIQNVVRRDNGGFIQYEVKINDSTAVIEDLTDVRYDFKKNSLRLVNQNEGVDLRNSTTLLLGLTRSIINTSINFGIHQKS